MRDVFAWIRAGRANENALRISRSTEHAMVDHHIVATLDEWPLRRELDEAGVAVLDAYDSDVVS